MASYYELANFFFSYFKSSNSSLNFLSVGFNLIAAFKS